MLELAIGRGPAIGGQFTAPDGAGRGRSLAELCFEYICFCFVSWVLVKRSSYADLVL